MSSLICRGSDSLQLANMGLEKQEFGPKNSQLRKCDNNFITYMDRLKSFFSLLPHYHFFSDEIIRTYIYFIIFVCLPFDVFRLAFCVASFLLIQLVSKDIYYPFSKRPIINSCKLFGSGTLTLIYLFSIPHGFLMRFHLIVFLMQFVR